MICRQVREKLYRYLDGESSKLEAARIGRHLNNCRECRYTAQSLTAIQDVVSESLRDDIAYPDLSDVVTSQLPAARMPARKPAWAFAFAAAVAVTIIGLAYYGLAPLRPRAQNGMVHHNRLEHRSAGRQLNTTRSYRSADAPHDRLETPGSIKQQAAHRAHRQLVKLEAVRTHKHTEPARVITSISIDVTPAVDANNISGMRMVTVIKTGDTIVEYEYMPAATQEAPPPGDEKIERPPLREAMSLSDSTHTM